MKQRKWSLTTDVKTRKRKYTRSSSNYYMYIWSNKSQFPVNGWPSQSNELMFRANGWPSRSNELVFRANGWPSRSNELVFRANGWTSCSNELVFRVNGWPSRWNGLVFRANGWPSRSNWCKVFSNGLQTVVNGSCSKTGVLNGVLIGISVYLSNGINIISWNHKSCFILVSNRQRLCRIIISSRKNYFIWKQRVPCIIRTFFLKIHLETRKSVCISNFALSFWRPGSRSSTSWATWFCYRRDWDRDDLPTNKMADSAI